MGKPLKISEEAAVQMPMKTVASLITLVAIGTWAFFGIQEKLNSNSTKLESVDTSHEHPVTHDHTKPLVNAKEIELLKVQIEEIKVSTSNPLSQ